MLLQSHENSSGLNTEFEHVLLCGVTCWRSESLMFACFAVASWFWLEILWWTSMWRPEHQGNYNNQPLVKCTNTLLRTVPSPLKALCQVWSSLRHSHVLVTACEMFQSKRLQQLRLSAASSKAYLTAWLSPDGKETETWGGGGGGLSHPLWLAADLT